MNSIKKRQVKILNLFKSVEESGLTVKEYFKSSHTPIGIAQYFRLKKSYALQGLAGLEDRRHVGNARKISLEEVEFIRRTLVNNPNLTSLGLQDELQVQHGMRVGQRRINQLRKELNLKLIKSTTANQETLQFAGIEIFSALAQHVGILEQWNTTIQQRIQQVAETQSLNANKGGDHVSVRHQDGTFSARYNRLASVRKTKFGSITDKVKSKDFTRLSISRLKTDNLNRKNLAL